MLIVAWRFSPRKPAALGRGAARARPYNDATIIIMTFIIIIIVITIISLFIIIIVIIIISITITITIIIIIIIIIISSSRAGPTRGGRASEKGASG